jgi:hypothetical protein
LRESFTSFASDMSGTKGDALSIALKGLGYYESIILFIYFQEYQKHITASDVDFEDTEMALGLVLEAASHANEMVRKLVCNLR